MFFAIHFCFYYKHQSLSRTETMLFPDKDKEAYSPVTSTLTASMFFSSFVSTAVAWLIPDTGMAMVNARSD